MPRSNKQKQWAAGMHVTTVAFTPEEFALVKSTIAKVESCGVAGWVNAKGTNQGKTTVTRFIRNAVMATAECLVDE